MYRIVVALSVRLRSPWHRDRGETGPLGYAVMVSAIVVLAVLVAAWGEDIASHFMDQVDEVDNPVNEGDPGSGGE